MNKRLLIGKMTLEIFDMEDKFISKLPMVTRKGVNRVYWIPVQKPPRAPLSEAVPFQMQIALMGGGIRYPAGDYKVKVTKGDKVFEKIITVYENPDEPYTTEDRSVRYKLQQRGFNLMEDLAYVDRRINDTRKGLEPIGTMPGISSSVKKKTVALQTSLEDIRERMLVTEYGDLRGDARLREDVGFLYGTVAFYDGRPTQVQIDRMDLLEKRVRAMEKEVDELLEDSLKSINKGLVRGGGQDIVISSREAFDAEKK